MTKRNPQNPIIALTIIYVMPVISSKLSNTVILSIFFDPLEYYWWENRTLAYIAAHIWIENTLNYTSDF